jgi:hypothetical protein
MDLVTWVDFQEKDYLAGGKVGTLEIKVRNYDVFMTSSGQYYIEFINSSLVKSRKYLGYTFGMDHSYEGNRVFYSKDTASAWIWTVDRYGQIYKMDVQPFYAETCKALLRNPVAPRDTIPSALQQ